MIRTSLSLPFWSDQEIEAAIAPTLRHLEEGGVLAYPTETVYGFGGAAEETAVEALVRMKDRPPAKPFLLLISGSEMLDRLGLILTSSAAALAARHWPGPLTLVLPGGEGRVPPRLRGPEGGIAVRWTPHRGLSRLLRAFGRPITSTSANRRGEPAAVTAAEVERDWAAQIRRNVILVLDGGRLVPSPPSTVVDCTGRIPRVVRPGAIAADILRESVPGLIGDV